jgi:hypothetical protein
MSAPVSIPLLEYPFKATKTRSGEPRPRSLPDFVPSSRESFQTSTTMVVTSLSEVNAWGKARKAVRKGKTASLGESSGHPFIYPGPRVGYP